MEKKWNFESSTWSRILRGIQFRVIWWQMLTTWPCVGRPSFLWVVWLALSDYSVEKKFSDILQILGSIWVPWQGIPAIIKTLNPWVKYIYIGGRLKFLKGRPDRTNKIYFRLIFILLTIWHRVRYKIFGTELFINGTESFINGTEFFTNGTESFTNGTEYFRNGTELFINSSFFKMAPKLYTVF